MLVDAGVHKQQFIAGERWAVEATMVSKGHTHSMLIVGALVHTGTTWDFNSYFYDFINESPQGTLLPDGAGRARIGKLKLEFIAGHKLYLKGRVRPDADTEVAGKYLDDKDALYDLLLTFSPVASIQAKNKKYCKVPVPGVVDGMNCITFVDKLWKEIR